MSAQFLLERFAEEPNSPAVVFQDTEYTYSWLSKAVQTWTDRLERVGATRGSVISIESDFSPEAVACVIAAINIGGILVPLTDSVAHKRGEFRDIAEVEWSIDPNIFEIQRYESSRSSLLLSALRDTSHPGLVLFSSGSTGASKAALHDLVPLLTKFETRRKPWRSIPFLLFDHIGGFNTLFYSLSNLGLLVNADDRSPSGICQAIQRYRVEMLPTSPSFLNLLLAGRAYERFDLSSLKMITYGTEPMSEVTLARLNELLPNVELKQTYGLSELGILATRSKSSGSIWMTIGGRGYEYRIVDGLLEIKAKSAMLGYLNAPSPFTPDGWFITGDAVEVDGEYIRVLGRRSEIINVGGQKVYPAEVEGVLEDLSGVVEASVMGEPHSIMGEIVVARVLLDTNETLPEFRSRMTRECAGRLDRFKIPQKVVLVLEDLHGPRFKKNRFQS